MLQVVKIIFIYLIVIGLLLLCMLGIINAWHRYISVKMYCMVVALGLKWFVSTSR